MKILQRLLIVSLVPPIIVCIFLVGSSVNLTGFLTMEPGDDMHGPVHLGHQYRYHGQPGNSSKSIPGRLPFLRGTRVIRSAGSGNRGDITAPQKSEVSARTFEIGVWGTQREGKWFGEFDCGPGPRDEVSVIQTTDYDRIAKSDVLFVIHSTRVNWERLKSNRPREQIWMYVSFESPHHAGNMKGHRDVFANDVNWTYTYRSDATFPSPYGAYYSRDTSSLLPENYANRAENKSGLVCALISNCAGRWPRMQMVHEIASHIETDIFGNCGSGRCPRGPRCDKILSKYKFYLAFENSACADYITEKFWHNALDNDIVPVVYGARPEDYEKMAPPNSYIHVENFPSIAHLAEYLRMLDRNDTLYNAYFDWKRKWYVRGNQLADYYEPEITMCRILQKLNEVNYTDSTGHRSGKTDLVESWVNSCK